jgi:hypothetical protein
MRGKHPVTISFFFFHFVAFFNFSITRFSVGDLTAHVLKTKTSAPAISSTTSKPACDKQPRKNSPSAKLEEHPKLSTKTRFRFSTKADPQPQLRKHTKNKANHMYPKHSF